MHAALIEACDRLAGAGVDWLLVAGAGRALLGGPGSPNDLDIETTREGAPRAAAALGLPAPADDAGGGIRSLRAGGVLGQVRVDLSGGVAVVGPGGADRLAPDWTAQHAAARGVELEGRRVLVGPPEEDLVKRLLVGDHAGAAKLIGTLPAAFVLRADYLARRLSAAASAAL